MKMKKFYKQIVNQDDNATWEADIRFWLLVCKEKLNPTKKLIIDTSKYLTSSKVKLNDLNSFCKLTHWKVLKKSK
jgi:hypothetical protein